MSSNPPGTAASRIGLTDDEPTVSVPSKALALALEALPCPHRPDTVCGACWDDVRGVLLDYLYPMTCFELDGARVHGDPNMSDESREAVREVIGAAKQILADREQDQSA